MRLRVVSVLILTIGCAARTWKAGEVEREEGVEEMDLGELPERAAFDFGCSSSKLRLHKIDDLTVGVKGCGKRGTYVEACRGDNWARKCTWVLNGVIESTKRKPQPEPAPQPKPEPQPEPAPQPASSSPDEP